MEHIIDVNMFFDSGLPVSDDITPSEVDMAIKTVEQYEMRPYFTNEKWNDILTNATQYENYIVGDENCAGLQQAALHLVFAYLLFDRIRLTRYSTVIKNDEHSSDPSVGDLMQVCQMHAEIGIGFMYEVGDLFREADEHYKVGKRNGFIYSELGF